MLLLLSPLFVMLLTSGVRKLQAVEFAVNRKPLLRFLAAVFAFGSAVALSLFSGEPLNENVSKILVESVYAFLGSQGVYLLSQSSKK